MRDLEDFTGVEALNAIKQRGLDSIPEEGIYQVGDGAEWVVVVGKWVKIRKAPTYDLGYLLRAYKGDNLCYRGLLKGDRKPREPNPLDLTIHLPT